MIANGMYTNILSGKCTKDNGYLAHAAKGVVINLNQVVENEEKEHLVILNVMQGKRRELSWIRNCLYLDT